MDSTTKIRGVVGRTGTQVFTVSTAAFGDVQKIVSSIVGRNGCTINIVKHIQK